MRIANVKASPFYGIGVGSTISSVDSKFGPPILNVPVTKFVEDNLQTTKMTGESAYVYSDSLNQGSLSVVGSYGVTGLAKFEAGISAYAGHSSQANRKETSLNYSLQLISGVEYVNFEDLTVMDLVNALSQGPKKKLLDALKVFTDIQKEVKETGIDILEVLAGKVKNQKLEGLLISWLKAVHAFYKDYGDGLVVGAIWGGVGEVALKIVATEKEENWRYGGTATFNYAGLSSAVSVAAAYDGSNTNRAANTQISVESFAIGGVVLAQVNKWADTLNDLGIQELWNTSVIEKAPSLSGKPDIPAIPAFQKPEPDKGVTDLFDKIGSLDALEAYSQASAYDAAKKEDPSLTLAKFLEAEKKKANTQVISEVKEKVEKNDVPAPKSIAGDEVADATAKSHKSHDNLDASADEDLAVLGTWIVNWSDLFPWLATGYDNDIKPDAKLYAYLSKQAVLQDLLALEQLYALFDNSGIDAKKAGISDFEALVIEYARAVEVLQDGFDRDDIVDQALSGLGKEAMDILLFWQENYFLRSAELGLGVLVEGSYSAKRGIKNATQLSQDYVQLVYEAVDLNIGDERDYYKFKETVTGIPLITPDGKCYFVAQNNMFLQYVSRDGGLVFSRDVETALLFEVNGDKASLVNSENQVTLHPIRFADAKGVNDWHGRIISNNLASNNNLIDKFGELEKSLEGLRKYSYSSDFFKTIDNWSPDTCYSCRTLPVQYFGLAESVGTIFKK